MIYLVTLIAIILDQVSKFLVLQNLTPGEQISVFPCFNLYLVFNKGVSFSILAGDSPYMPWILSACAIVICLCIVRWMMKETDKVLLFGLALILGGAIANVIDRLRFGSVVDFLDFYIGTYHWPAFNIADSCICIGAALVLYHSLRKDKK